MPGLKCRARGRIEQTLLAGDAAPTDLETFARNLNYTTQKSHMFLSTTKARDSSHTGVSGTFLGNRAESVNYR